MYEKDLFEKVPYGIVTSISTYENYRNNSDTSKDYIEKELKSRDKDIEYFKSMESYFMMEFMVQPMAE